MFPLPERPFEAAVSAPDCGNRDGTTRTRNIIPLWDRGSTTMAPPSTDREQADETDQDERVFETPDIETILDENSTAEEL